MASLAVLLLLVVLAAASSLNDCVRTWQQPMMTRALIDQPSRPHPCHPEGNKCPAGRNEQCQFSFRSFRYVCCEDKENEDPPVCPRHFDTLLSMCDHRENACPKGYRCLGSRHDESLKLCCRPNPSLTYPEPETTFKDRRIVPKFLPVAPRAVAQIHFGNHTIITGEVFSSYEIEQLEAEPFVEIPRWDNDTLYTIGIFGTLLGRGPILSDISAPHPVYVRWLIVNVPVEGGRLMNGRKARVVEAYDVPHLEEEPAGMHVLVLAVFKQIEIWNGKSIGRFDPIGLNLKDWLRQNDDMLETQPVAGNFFAFMASTNAY